MRNRIIILLLFMPFLLPAQEKVWIEGRVKSSDSLINLQNVHVISKLARSGTITDDDGRFWLRGYPTDTLLFSSIGFRRKIVGFSQAQISSEGVFEVLMAKDTVKMEEVVVRAFYDWDTFKYLFVNMTTIKPTELERLNEELETSLMYVRPAPFTIKGPIQALYDVFNDMARLQRRLERNRKWYNKQMIREGRIQDTIPEKPDHIK